MKIIFKVLDILEEGVMILGLIAMVILNFVNVICRFLLPQTPFSYTEELTILIFGWVTMFGIAYGLQKMCTYRIDSRYRSPAGEYSENHDGFCHYLHFDFNGNHHMVRHYDDSKSDYTWEYPSRLKDFIRMGRYCSSSWRNYDIYAFYSGLY